MTVERQENSVLLNGAGEGEQPSPTRLQQSFVVYKTAPGTGVESTTERREQHAHLQTGRCAKHHQADSSQMGNKKLPLELLRPQEHYSK